MQAIQLILLKFCDCRMLPALDTDVDPHIHSTTCLYRKIFDMLSNGDTDARTMRELIRVWHGLLWIKDKR